MHTEDAQGEHVSPPKPTEAKSAPRPFKDPEKAREAAKRRWELAGQDKAQRAEQSDAEVLVPIRRRKIIEALEAKAVKGDVQAAKLVLEHPIAERTDVLSLLSREQRATVRQWLLDNPPAKRRIQRDR